MIVLTPGVHVSNFTTTLNQSDIWEKLPLWIISWHCYGTTITIKFSEGAICFQKAMLNVAAHHTVFDQAALIGVTCHVFRQNHSRGLAGVNPMTVISYNGLSDLQQDKWLG